MIIIWSVIIFSFYHPLYISLYIHKQTKAVVSNNNTKNSDKERKSPNLIQSYVHLI